MKPKQPRAKRPPITLKPDVSLPAIQLRLLNKIRNRKTSLAERVTIGISLLKSPAFAQEAMSELQNLCEAPGLPHKTFTKIGKALTKYEGNIPLKVKRERERAAPHDFKGPATWAMLIDVNNEGLMDKWRALHPEEYDKDNVRRFGVYAAAWAKHGARITKLLRKVGVPPGCWVDDKWWAEHEGVRARLEGALAEFMELWSEPRGG